MEIMGINLKISKLIKNAQLGVVHKLRHAFRGEGGGQGICVSPYKRFFFLWKICDKEGGVEKVIFLRDVIYERTLIPNFVQNFILTILLVDNN